MDTLSHLLQTLRVERAQFGEGLVPLPQARTADSEHPPQLVFYQVLEGRCTLTVEGGTALALEAGDVAVLCQGHAHRLLPSRPEVGKLAAAGDARLLWGRIGCDAALCRQLLGLLPPVFTLRFETAEVDGWLGACRRMLSGPADAGPGAAGVRTKACELLLTELLQRQLGRATGGVRGEPALAGRADRIVGACLAAMHAAPAEPWTLETLARKGNTSRSVLAERFKLLVGQSPMAYLARLRLSLAARLLRDTSLCMGRVAEQVGYDTDTAFNRAFRREFGLPPATWRRAHAVRETAAAVPAPVAADTATA